MCYTSTQEKIGDILYENEGINKTPFWENHIRNNYFDCAFAWWKLLPANLYGIQSDRGCRKLYK